MLQHGGADFLFAISENGKFINAKEHHKYVTFKTLGIKKQKNPKTEKTEKTESENDNIPEVTEIETNLPTEQENLVEEPEHEIEVDTPLEKFLNLEPQLQKMLSFKSETDPNTGDKVISNLTEYKFMQYVLSDYDNYILVDWHVESTKENVADERQIGQHPVTYADVKIDENGKEVPRETQLTDKDDLGAKMCLDYVFQIIPSVKIQESESTEDFVKIPIGHKLNGQCKVQPFFIDFEKEGEGKVIQCSDHYGVELEFEI